MLEFGVHMFDPLKCSSHPLGWSSPRYVSILDAYNVNTSTVASSLLRQAAHLVKGNFALANKGLHGKNKTHIS